VNYKKFEELPCWSKARELCQAISNLINKGEFRNDFSLRDQIPKFLNSLIPIFHVIMMKKLCEGRTMKERLLFFGEEGSVLIVALVVVALFTLLSISSTATTNMEIRITGNENIQKENLYAAEAAAMRGAQDMQDNDLRTSSLAYLNGINSATQSQSDITSLNHYTLSDTLTELPATTAFASVSRGIAAGSSLDMTKTRVHEYSVYGWCNRNKNLVIVEVGYRKSF